MERNVQKTQPCWLQFVHCVEQFVLLGHGQTGLFHFSLFTCALKRDAQVVFCKGFYFFFGISHSPRTLLGHAHCKHYVDKLQRFSPNCHNTFMLTMPTALGRRSGAVYGENSPKTRLVHNYCDGNTLYIVNLVS